MSIASNKVVSKKILTEGFRLLCMAREMTLLYEENFKEVSKYVHATSRGHEAIQIACGMQLLPQDYAAPYYRDDAMLLSLGMRPYDLMLQLLAKADDPFSGGRSYYSHPSLRDEDKPTIPHQSSATGMQAIPAAGIAMGLQYQETLKFKNLPRTKGIVVCSLGDASVTEGEVSEAFQMAGLRQLPILFLVQDNGWDISANAEETRAQNAAEYIQGFHGVEGVSIDGSDFQTSYRTIHRIFKTMRKERRPFLLHASVPLLNHHTSGVRMEWYRDDLEEAKLSDPYPILKNQLLEAGVSKKAIAKLEKEATEIVAADFVEARKAKEPTPVSIYDHIFAPTPITEETGERTPENGEMGVMVDAALHAIEELMTEDKRCLLYGQDVGARLGGVFREAATLAQKFGDDRVFNTPIQEAFIVGSTVGMSAAGMKPIVEVQFADYIFPGINQLFTEVSRSCYLSNGKFPVSMILRVPIGAYGSGGPYHSSSVESIVTRIQGIKIVYPSCGADLKGLIKAAYHDPNPVVIFEHKGLYWSKVPGTAAAKTIEPAADYILPLGIANKVLEAEPTSVKNGEAMVVITYGMGVHWALNAANRYPGQVTILDLRTLVPLDEEAILELVRSHHRCLVLTEEPARNSFSQSLAGWIQEECFKSLDAPVRTLGSAEVPAIGLNSILEKATLPNVEMVEEVIGEVLGF